MFCPSCELNCGTQYTHKKKFNIFPVTRPLAFIAIDILGPLPLTKWRNQFVLVITDGYSKRTTALPHSKTTAFHVSSLFLQYWVLPHGIPSDLLTSIGHQFASKLFAPILTYQVLKQLTTTAYHLQNNFQMDATIRRSLRDHITMWPSIRTIRMISSIR